MSNIPKTIHSPDAFERSKPCGFDGAFDWSWTQGCFGERITPMDFDGVVERNGYFLVFESKNEGVDVPRGQEITLKSVYDLECFTIVFIQGKLSPVRMLGWQQPGFLGGEMDDSYVNTSPEEMRAYCMEWYKYVDSAEKRKNPADYRTEIMRLRMDLDRTRANHDALRRDIHFHIKSLVDLILGKINYR